MLQNMLRNPEMRRMMFSPEMMRMQLQMQRNMGGDAGRSSFPAPGATDNTPQATANNTSATPNQPGNTGAADPFSMFGGGGAGANPLAGLFAGANPFAPQQQQNQNTANTTGSNTPQQNPQGAGTVPPNPFGNLFGGAQGQQANPFAEAAHNLMQNPEAMRSMLQAMGGDAGGAGAAPFAAFGQPPAAGAGAANPFAALFGPGGGFGAPPPADTRPPEEVYESQLRQLNEMGFYEFERNVAALRRSGGNVQGAIEHLLGGGS